MKKPVFLLPGLVVLAVLMLTPSCSNENIITFRSLLREMTDPEYVTRYPDPSYRLVQFSS